MSHLPRVPVQFLTQNQELLKSQESMAGGAPGATDYKQDQDAPVAIPEPQMRAPGDRNIGNLLFRRNPDGTLDVEAAKMVVVDIIHRAKDLLPLTEQEKIVLGCFFPMQFPGFIDQRLVKQITAVQLRLAPWEVMDVAMAVSSHLMQEMSYNAGRGGYPTPSRRA